ncbi:uncharacterized protein ColSpa_04581 [Colletotrichum spaethianum]|uniref:Uncharacterized protein n=1 Tax=Colletotrichum spaethianum TaxID=700344 RepID=A0AA37LD50_9PEZI|nr:uncharacterized protein ColSpa_04581 [Colletotrichum spaethianum]GKT44400.1 hypothetical protein ColSpa_04581 [Colletotrichum spaethianum]
MSGKSQESPSRPYGWLARCLRWPYLLTFAVFDVSLAITIIALTIASSQKNGFVTVSTDSIASTGQNSDIVSLIWNLGVLWTSLPSFVFSLFGAYWAWISASLAERQPYVELRKDGGAEARKSILLDYRVVATVWRWWGAFQKSHFTVGSMTMLSLFLTYLIAPLAARLFVAQGVTLSEPAPITYNKAYNIDNINATLDWRPVLDTVSATLLYGGNSIPWTDKERAFRPFVVDPLLANKSDMAANTTAYSGYLNCELVKDYAITSSGDSVEVSGNDRGCDFKQSFTVVKTQEIYLKTTVDFDCSAQAYYSRLVFTAAKYSDSAPNNIDDISVISCATGYRQVAGTLRVSPSKDVPTVASFVETSEPDTSRPKLWRVFEQGILGPVTFNPQAKWSTSDMGNLILYYTQRAQPSNRLGSDALMEAIPKVFTAIYLNAVAIHGFDPLPDLETATGTAFVPTTRLFVISWVAYVIITFLAIALCSVGFVFFRLQGTPSILTEEPQGLLSLAAILDKSELLGIASKIRQEKGFDGKIWKRGMARSDVKDKKWRAAMNPETGNWVVRAVRNDEMELTEYHLA